MKYDYSTLSRNSSYLWRVGFQKIFSLKKTWQECGYNISIAHSNAVYFLEMSQRQIPVFKSMEEFPQNGKGRAGSLYCGGGLEGMRDPARFPGKRPQRLA